MNLKIKSCAAYSQKAVIPLFFLILLIIPFSIGDGARIGLILMLDIACLLSIFKTEERKKSMEKIKLYINHPISWSLLALLIAVLFSVPFSPDVRRSLEAFTGEFLVNIITFSVLVLYSARFCKKTDFIKGILGINIIFLIIYMGVMLQWALAEDHLWFVDPDIIPKGSLWWLDPAISIKEASPIDKILSYGDGNLLVNSIKHTALYLLLFIAVIFVLIGEKREYRLLLPLLTVNLATLVSTTKRGSMIASVAGMGCAAIFYSNTRKLIFIGILLIAMSTVFIFASGKDKYLIREDWNLLLHGKVAEAKKKGGSIPMRIYAYTEYVKTVFKHPFKGIGPERRNIKKAYPDVIKRCGLIHAHNVFINTAIYSGIQGMLALAAVIVFQAKMVWRLWKKATQYAERTLAAVTILFMIMFWVANIFTDGFNQGSALLYWMVTAIAVGRSLDSGNHLPHPLHAGHSIPGHKG